MWFRKALYILFFLSAQNILSQSVVLQNYTEQNKLETDEIFKIFQDSREYVWVSTRNGLYIQNMENFIQLNYFNQYNFLNVRDILEDEDHNMWFASYGDGIIYFDGIRFTHFSIKNGLLSNRNSIISEDKENIYVGGVGGISIINKKTKKIEKAILNHVDRNSIEIKDILKIKNGIYITTNFNGIYKLDGNQLIFYKKIPQIVKSYIYKNDLVISSNNGVFIYDIPSFNQTSNYYKKINIPIIRDYALVNDNKYWMLTSDLVNSNGYIYEFKDVIKENKRILTDINLETEQPRGIIYDKVNNLVYISSLDSGLKRILLDMPYNFNSLNDQDVIKILTINSLNYVITKSEFFIRNKKNTIHKTSLDTFFNYFQKNKVKFKKYYENHSDFFNINYSIDKKNVRFYHLKFHQNYFWIGSNIGLFKLDINGNIINMYPIHTYNFEFSNNSLVDSHPYKGIKVFSDLENLKYDYFDNNINSIPSYVASMDRVGETVFFASSIYGLYKYENGKFYSYYFNNKLNETKLKLVKGISNNRLIISTEFGDVYVLKINGDELQVERKINKNLINSNNIQLLDEINGNLIVGTHNTLVIINKDQLFYLDKTQGLKFNKMTSSSVANNRLLLGVNNGYYDFDIERIIKYEGRKHKVLITGLKINNLKVSRFKFKWFDLQNRDLELNSSENNLILDFVLINPKYPDKFKFRYRLNNDKDWSEYFDKNSIQLNSLKYGKYKIDLEIIDLNGNKSEIIHLINFKINPPFYLNPFFIILNVIALGLILFLFYRQKIKNIKKINEIKIEQIEVENLAKNKQISLEKKISELKLMALQSQMNPHFIFNILNSIQYYIIDQDTENALSILNKFARLIRKMLDLSRESSISIVEKIEFLKLYVEIENSRYKNKIQFVVNVDSDIDIYNTFIPPMLLQPLIENVFIHAFDHNKLDNKLELNIINNQDHYIFEVIDNGKGFNINNSKEIFHQSKGLKIIKERLSLLNNSDGENCLVFLANNPGTIVRLYLKK